MTTYFGGKKIKDETLNTKDENRIIVRNKFLKRNLL